MIKLSKSKYFDYKSCPFCGSNKVKLGGRPNGLMPFKRLKVTKYLYSVHCTNCDARGGAASNELDAIRLWNTRN